MARDGVQIVKATPEGLYGHGGTEGIATALMVPWERVPFDVRQHLSAVYRFLNDETDKRVAEAATRARDKRILDADRREARGKSRSDWITD
jgi:hypothetical protein